MEKIKKLIDKKLIFNAEKYLWEHPETGFRELETSRFLEENIKNMGYTIVKAEKIPGFYTIIDTGIKGPEILVLAEMDSLICPNHKDAKDHTGYVHACGHHTQGATLLGIAKALKDKEFLKDLCGRIRLCGVPAEELIEIGYRLELKKSGIIKYLVGKCEFLSRGYFDGVDMAIMVHASKNFRIDAGMVGCIAKTVRYKGVSAHAGGSPWNGKNALYAATQGISAVNAIRETFKEEDLTRFHPIISYGGEAVNAIPHLVVMESFVRGKTYDAILKTNRKINQALCGGALCIGGNVEIEDIPGYAPLNNDKNLIVLTKEAAERIIPEENIIVTNIFSSGSSDIGDLSGIMPVVQVYSSGIKGNPHGDDFEVYDVEKACVKPAMLQLMMIKMLLENGGERANKVLAEFKPLFKTKEDYFEYINKIYTDGDRLYYNSDDNVTIKI